ncbi:hypothetical protein QG37_04702 [Candidozyma auris]|uniref:Uncharacterized protein n=1 Tax=Candidozyma auris TaxID=498019 RepID=A0A0L0NX59_CANAR|nr:hypothetical protein QG37_04702 [[Candida] auris]
MFASNRFIFVAKSLQAFTSHNANNTIGGFAMKTKRTHLQNLRITTAIVIVDIVMKITNRSFLLYLLHNANIGG